MKIIFEFVGGSRDGQTEAETHLAGGFYRMTHDGEIGKRFMGLTEYGTAEMLRDSAGKGLRSDIRAEKYEVFDRLETEDQSEVYVRCRFVGYGN
jgi:hypothetical protein